MKKLESDILAEVMAAIGSFGDLWIARNNNGALINEHGRPVVFGLGPGTPDIMGVFCVQTDGEPLGVAVGIEVKRPGEKLSPDQVRAHKVLRSFGARVFTVYSAADAVAAVEMLRAEFPRAERAGAHVC